jgi:hypothetical protein
LNAVKQAIAAVVLISSTYARAAEYAGEDIDGEAFHCNAFSYATSKVYSLICEFSGDEVILHFPKGGRVRASLDSEEIENPNKIEAFDHKRKKYWILDVDM